MAGGSTGKAATASAAKKGGSKDAGKGTSRGAFPSGGRKQKWELEPKWVMDHDFKPPRKISDKELEQARKMFFEVCARTRALVVTRIRSAVICACCTSANETRRSLQRASRPAPLCTHYCSH